MTKKYQCTCWTVSSSLTWIGFLKIPIYMWSLTSKTDTGQRRQTGCETANKSQLVAAFTHLGEAHFPSNKRKKAAVSLTFPATFFHSPRCLDPIWPGLIFSSRQKAESDVWGIFGVAVKKLTFKVHRKSCPVMQGAWRLARDEMYKKSQGEWRFLELKSNTCYISNSNSSTTSKKNAAKILTRLSITNSRFILHTSDFSSTISRFETRKTKKNVCFFNHRWRFSRKCSHPKRCMYFLIAGLCCCTFVGFNQGLIFEAMPMLYMASRKAPKTNNFCRWFGKLGIHVKTYTSSFRKLWFFVQTCSKATTSIIVAEENVFFFSKKVLSTAMSSIKNQSFATILRQDQSNHLRTRTSAHKSNTQPPAEIEIFPFDCGQGTCAYPFYESNVSMKCLNQFRLYVVWMATGWSHGFVARRTVQKKSESPVFHHFKCYLMISLLL